MIKNLISINISYLHFISIVQYNYHYILRKKLLYLGRHFLTEVRKYLEDGFQSVYRLLLKEKPHHLYMCGICIVKTHIPTLETKILPPTPSENCTWTHVIGIQNMFQRRRKPWILKVNKHQKCLTSENWTVKNKKVYILILN